MSNKDSGFITLHRQIRDHWIWEDGEWFKAWVDILMSASYHDSEIKAGKNVVKIPRGSWHTSILSLSKRWGWSRNRVKRFLDTLEGASMITVQSTTIGTTLTIVNYGKFQNKGATNGTTNETTDGASNETTNGTTGGPHSTNKNNINKKNKKTKGAPSYTFSEEEMDSHDPNDEAYWKEWLRRKNEREGIS